MAQGDLYKLLKRVNLSLARDMDSKGKGSERFRKRIEKLPHDLYLDYDSIRNEIFIQLKDFALTDEINRTNKAQGLAPISQGIRQTYGSGSGRSRAESAAVIQSLGTETGYSKTQIAAVDGIAKRFIGTAKAVARAKNKGFLSEILEDTGKTLVVRFTPTASGANAYNLIKDKIFKLAKADLLRTLNAAGFNKISETQRDIFFNVGHVNAVSTLKAAEAVQKINTGTSRLLKKYDDPLSSQAVDTLRLGVLSKFLQLGRPEYSKQFLFKAAVVKAESQATNITDSDYERALLNDLKKALADTIAKMPKEWASQKSSDSVIDLVANDLFGQIHTSFKNKSIKLTGQKPRKRNVSQNSAENQLKIKRPKISTVTVLGKEAGLTVKTPTARSSAVNMQSLIPILNQGLSEIIRSYMGQQGRLTNRTGRFSESAEVISISGDGLEVGFTYQMAPYGVFEKQGARDPRPLIEMSIREAARGLMAARFNVRRL